MNPVDRIRAILRDTLQLGARADALTEQSRLLGAVPEFDSIAVISVVTMIEEEFDITVHDDELSADTFETVGSLVRFVVGKAGR
jgi:acyl carrier protein